MPSGQVKVGEFVTIKIIKLYHYRCELDLYFLFYFGFNSQAHIVTGSVRVEEPVHTSWSSFCTVNHQAPASNYQLSNMKSPGQDSNRRPQRLNVSAVTATAQNSLIGVNFPGTSCEFKFYCPV